MGGDGEPEAWQDAAFQAEARAWILARLGDAGLVATGPLEPVRARPWSTVLRMPTDGGYIYFKANAEKLRHEAALAQFLAERRSDCIPAPLAVDRRRGWMLMADAGTRLRELVAAERSADRWLDVLPLYAGVQIDLAADADALLDLGVPDLRLDVLPARYERLLDELEATAEVHGPHGLTMDLGRRLRDAAPSLAAMCEELASLRIPETIQHDDLNDGQVFVRNGRYLLMDWADACVSHPFFSMSVALEGVIAWGVDDVEGSVDLEPSRKAYLRPFEQARAAAGLPAADLQRALTIALRLGWACRAVNDQWPGSGTRQTLVRLRMFLDGRA